MYYRSLASAGRAFALSNGGPDSSGASAARGCRGAPVPGRPDPAAQVEVAGVACRPRCWRPAYGNVPWSSRLRKKRMTTALLFSTRCARGPLSEWKDAQEPSRAADCGPRRDRPRRAETVPGRSRALGLEGSNEDLVVLGERKCKQPVHAAGAPAPRLGHQPDGFEPAEDL